MIYSEIQLQQPCESIKNPSSLIIVFNSAGLIYQDKT